MRGEGARLPISINSTGFERRRRRRKGSWVSPGSVSGLTLAVWEKRIGEETRLSVRKYRTFPTSWCTLQGNSFPIVHLYFLEGENVQCAPLDASSSHSFGRHFVSGMPRLRLTEEGKLPGRPAPEGKAGERFTEFARRICGKGKKKCIHLFRPQVNPAPLPGSVSLMTTPAISLQPPIRHE